MGCIKRHEGRSVSLYNTRYIKGITLYKWNQANKIGGLNSYVSPNNPPVGSGPATSPKYPLYDQDIERLRLGQITPGEVRLYGLLDRISGIKALANCSMNAECFRMATGLSIKDLRTKIALPIGLSYDPSFDIALLEQITSGFSQEQLDEKSISDYSVNDILRDRQFSALSLKLPILSPRCNRIDIKRFPENMYDVGFNVGKSIINSVLTSGLIFEEISLHLQNFLYVPLAEKDILSYMVDFEDQISIARLDDNLIQQILFYLLYKVFFILDRDLKATDESHEEKFAFAKDVYKTGFLHAMLFSEPTEHNHEDMVSAIGVIGNSLHKKFNGLDVGQLGEIGILAFAAKKFKKTKIIKRTFIQRNASLAKFGLLDKVLKNERLAFEEYLNLFHAEDCWPREIFEAVS